MAAVVSLTFSVELQNMLVDPNSRKLPLSISLYPAGRTPKRYESVPSHEVEDFKLLPAVELPTNDIREFHSELLGKCQPIGQTP
jgi:hypothetical protein